MKWKLRILPYLANLKYQLIFYKFIEFLIIKLAQLLKNGNVVRYTLFYVFYPLLQSKNANQFCSKSNNLHFGIPSILIS